MGKSISNTFWACKEHIHNSTLRCAICDEQHIAKLEAQVYEEKRLYLSMAERLHYFTTEEGNYIQRAVAEAKYIEQLQAQLLAVTNENRKLLDPNGELLPPLTAIKGEDKT